jgi:hypothetical protein
VKPGGDLTCLSRADAVVKGALGPGDVQAGHCIEEGGGGVAKPRGSALTLSLFRLWPRFWPSTHKRGWGWGKLGSVLQHATSLDR